MPGRPHVLVVDNEPLIVHALRALFEMQGLRVSTAASGAEARRQLAAGPVSAVVTDLNMPGGGGAELVADLRHDARTPPVIVLTADDQAAGKLLRLGNVQVLRKPARIGEILAAMARALG